MIGNETTSSARSSVSTESTGLNSETAPISGVLGLLKAHRMRDNHVMSDNHPRVGEGFLEAESP